MIHKVYGQKLEKAAHMRGLSLSDIGAKLGYKTGSFKLFNKQDGGSLTIEKAKAIVGELYEPEVYKITHQDAKQLKIKSIKLIGNAKVMDIEVESTHNYMANDLIVHNCIGKKQKKELDIYIPQIKERFIKTMVEKHSTDTSEAEELVQSFLQVINDASDYGFSINHSQAYSYIGYVNAYLRHYHPLEFGAVQLQILATEAKDGYKEKTAAVTAYLKSRGITVVPPKFRFAKSKYAVDKMENKIFKDTKSIKGVQTVAGDNLYSLRDREYKYFTDLLVDVTEGALANKTSLLNLIKLNFFSEFGGNAKLIKIFEEFDGGKNKYDKKHVAKTKEKRLPLLYAFEKSLEDESLSLGEQIAIELELLEYVQSDLSKLDRSAILVTAVDTKYSPRLSVMRLNNGETTQVKMSKSNYYTREGHARLTPGDIVKFISTAWKNKSRKTETGWEKLDEQELWLNSFEMVVDL